MICESDSFCFFGIDAWLLFCLDNAVVHLLLWNADDGLLNCFLLFVCDVLIF